MELNLKNVGKSYRRDWIFRGVNFQFLTGKKYAVTGPNGSGKSTFLKVLSGHLTPNKGSIDFLLKKNGTETKVELDKVFRYVSYAGPYIELPEEFSLPELLNFHRKFKNFQNGLSTNDLIELSGLSASAEKEIRFFSSGMKQRVKLILAICTDSPLLLLDEPSTNLDRPGMNWYRDLVNRFSTGRTVIIASNVEEDFDFCDERIEITDYKKTKTK